MEQQNEPSMATVDRKPAPAARGLIPIGTPVYGNWGAMHPRWTGRIIEAVSNEYMIEWDEWCETQPSRHRVAPYPPERGSPIGVYVDRQAIRAAATEFPNPVPAERHSDVLRALEQHGRAVIGTWFFSLDAGWIWGTDPYGVDFIASQEVSLAGVEKMLERVKRQEESTDPHPAEFSH